MEKSTRLDRLDRLVDDFSIDSTWQIFDRLHRSTTGSTSGATCCDDRQSVSVCMSASISQKPDALASPKFLCLLHVSVAWSCFRGAVIGYVLPVL